LFHGSYPYGGELSAIAKAFGNVYLDLTWVYVLSPSFSQRYLHEWLETIPASKITGFGGDYGNVENAYGHLLFAKQIISRVLIDKVKDGYFSEEEAKKIARMLLHDNAIKIYKLSPSEQMLPEQLYYAESPR
jgi:predicted TIM-barrel fold metal-dependent hydrolase